MFFKKVDLTKRSDGLYELWVKKGDQIFEVILLDEAELEVIIAKYRETK